MRTVNVPFLKFLSEIRIQDSANYGWCVQSGSSHHVWRLIVDLLVVSRCVRPGFLFFILFVPLLVLPLDAKPLFLLSASVYWSVYISRWSSFCFSFRSYRKDPGTSVILRPEWNRNCVARQRSHFAFLSPQRLWDLPTHLRSEINAKYAYPRNPWKEFKVMYANNKAGGAVNTPGSLIALPQTNMQPLWRL